MPLTITYPGSLPVSARRDEIATAISAHQVVVVSGETGSGKTTQIPKICLDLQQRGLLFEGMHSDSGRRTRGKDRTGIIGHTQPRRIAARSVAERIAEELDVRLGAEVGYQVRFDRTVAANTEIKVMTDGVLLSEIGKDPMLRRYSVIIVDEAHERSLNIDFLLGYLKKLLRTRHDLKVIVTSATIDTEKFRKHFSENREVPVVEVSGRSYPVETRYDPVDESSDEAIADAVVRNTDVLLAETTGDVLVFLAGEHDIREVQDTLKAHFIRRPRSKGRQSLGGSPDILPLFGRISLAEQHRVFSREPGVRRVILSTNVAETSLTVPNITAVIDTGLARISRYSPRAKVQRLPIEPVSQASAAQRAGRCGRVSAGVCVRLYSEEDFAARPQFTDPEIMRSNLAGVILQMSALGLANDAHHVMSFDFVDPPSPRAVTDGIAVLQEIGALERYRLTRIGRSLAALPLDPRLARMLLESKKHGAQTEAIVIAAALTVQDPRERPLEKQDQADSLHQRFADKLSDFSTLLNLWRYICDQQRALSSSAFRKLCRAEFLNFLAVRQWQDLYEQLRRTAKPLGVEAPPLRRLNRESGGVDPVAAYEGLHKSIVAGFLSHIGLKNERADRRNSSSSGSNRTTVHGNSGLSDYTGARNSYFSIFPGSTLFRTRPEWVVAAELVETTKLWGRMAAKVEAEWIEEVAAQQPHLLKRSYSEPHWSKKSGAVLAYEKVTLYGLPVVSGRRANYGKIDPETSRELFIRHALVEGQWNPLHAFWRRNRKMLRELKALEERAGRRGLKADDQVLYDFYADRIPEGIVSVRHFDAWWKNEQHQNPKLLDFTEELLSTQAAGTINVSDFPRLWPLQNYPGDEQPQIELRYSYDHGVTARIPLGLLRDVDGLQFRWQVPGYRQELVAALIKAMPKGVRKNFVPAPDTARRAVEILDADYTTADDFQEALSQVLRRLKGYPVPDTAWIWDGVEPRLRVSFRVVDEKGREVKPPRPVDPKDLAGFKEALADRMRLALVASMGVKPLAPSPERTNPTSPGFKEYAGLSSWNIGLIGDVLPEEIVSGISRASGYPALVDEGGAVAVRLLPYRDAAHHAHRRGVVRLLYLRVLETNQGILSYLGKHLSIPEKLALSRSSYASPGAAPGKMPLLDDVVYAAVLRLVTDVPRTEKDFEAVFQRVRADIIDESFETVKTVAEICSLADVVLQALDDNSFSVQARDAVNDMRDQLSHLVYPGFIVDTPPQYLRRLPAYLKAITARYGKLSRDIDGDYASMREIQSLEDEFDAVESAHRARQYGRTVQLENARWMLEEFRISLFAQGQGTLYKVSTKRIRTALQRTMEQ